MNNISKDFKLEICHLFFMRDNVTDKDTKKKVDLMLSQQISQLNNETELLNIRLKFNTFYNSL